MEFFWDFLDNHPLSVGIDANLEVTETYIASQLAEFYMASDMKTVPNHNNKDHSHAGNAEILRILQKKKLTHKQKLQTNRT